MYNMYRIFMNDDQEMGKYLKLLGNIIYNAKDFKNRKEATKNGKKQFLLPKSLLGTNILNN